MQTSPPNRDKYLKQRRRQHFYQLLNHHRKNFHKKCQQQTRQDFLKIYPQVNQYNYEQFKNQLAGFAAHKQYSYQVSIFGPLVHDYLIQHNTDTDSVTILKYITQFEDIQIPQTQQFAHCLTSLAHSSLIDSLLIVSNLLTSQHYQNLLRDHLLEQNYIQQIDTLLFHQNQHQDTEIHNLAVLMFSQILCTMLVSNPLLSLNQISTFITKIKKLTPIQQQIKWTLMQTFTTIRQKIKLNNKYAKLLLKQFQSFIIEQKHWAYIHILDLLLYAAHSNIFSTNTKIITLLQNTVTNIDSIQSQVFIKGLQCFHLYIKQLELDLNDQIIENLLTTSALTAENPNCQLTILQVLETVKDQDLGQILVEHQNRDEIIYQLVKSIQKFNTRNTALIVISKLVINYGDSGLKQHFDSHGIKTILQSTYLTLLNNPLKNQLQTLLSKLPTNPSPYH